LYERLEFLRGEGYTDGFFVVMSKCHVDDVSCGERERERQNQSSHLGGREKMILTLWQSSGDDGGDLLLSVF
jgi:hypothetical protein